jgi:pyruvate kinase
MRAIRGGYEFYEKDKNHLYAGPAVDNVDMTKSPPSGVNAVRFNFSHGTHEEHRERLDRFKKARAELGVWAASILDTKVGNPD